MSAFTLQIWFVVYFRRLKGEKMTTIPIELRLFANFRAIVDITTTIMHIEQGISIRIFLQFLRDTLPGGDELYPLILDTQGELVSYIKIIVDGHILFKHELDSIHLTNANTIVAIFPPVGGG